MTTKTFVHLTAGAHLSELLRSGLPTFNTLDEAVETVPEGSEVARVVLTKMPSYSRITFITVDGEDDPE